MSEQLSADPKVAWLVGRLRANTFDEYTGDEDLKNEAADVIERLEKQEQAASDFIRGVIDALGFEDAYTMQEGKILDLELLRLQVVGQIETLKGEVIEARGESYE